jgi:acetoin utilization deacetylase AcuC-like enzyme
MATETALTNDPRGETAATFALIRPPGHHATTSLCGGYCYLNNVIICASHFLRHHQNLKCTIIDIDFHHGNGVEEILSRPKKQNESDWRERVKYISLHAHPEYPYYTTHLPSGLPKTVTSKEYLEILTENLNEAERRCGEENLVLVSLGLDTFFEDPIGGFAGFTEMEDYRRVGSVIGTFVDAVKGRCAFLLEGGYVVEKLGECVEAVFRGYMRALKK